MLITIVTGVSFSKPSISIGFQEVWQELSMSWKVLARLSDSAKTKSFGAASGYEHRRVFLLLGVRVSSAPSLLKRGETNA